MSEEERDQLVSLSEATEALGITKAMARRWGRTGRLPLVRDGLRSCVRKEDLRALVDQRAPGASEALPYPNGEPEGALDDPEELSGVEVQAEEPA